MSLCLDHAIVAVHDLEQAIHDYRSLGFTVIPGGVHANRATHNALIRLRQRNLPGAAGCHRRRYSRGCLRARIEKGALTYDLVNCAWREHKCFCLTQSLSQ